MQPSTVEFLVGLNQRFYAEFGPAFAQTRRRIQDGVRRVLSRLPDEGAWLDVGCGSGALVLEWLQDHRQSSYWGVDFSPSLLAEARQSAAESDGYAQDRMVFVQSNLLDPQWTLPLLTGAPFRGALAFAVLHHLPSQDLRARVLRQIQAMLQPGGWFIHSEWQFQHSPKMMARRLPWETLGLSPDQLDPGDTLLDWRFSLPGQADQRGLRYVHLFTLVELNDLARQTGFEVLDTFESDGQGGRLGLYQVWRSATVIQDAAR